MNELIEGADLCLNESQKNTDKNEPLYIRVIRKKYKCILILLLAIISLSQVMYISLDKFDTKFFEHFLEKFLEMSNNSTNCVIPEKQR